MTKEKVESLDLSVELTEEEKLKIEQEARADIMKALKAEKKEQFKDSAKRRLTAERIFRLAQDENGEDMVDVQLELASHPKFIMLDGKIYHDSRIAKKKHRVRQSVAAVLLDQMDRGWRQEEARRGEKVEMLSPVRSMAVSPGLRYA